LPIRVSLKPYRGAKVRSFFITEGFSAERKLLGAVEFRIRAEMPVR